VAPPQGMKKSLLINAGLLAAVVVLGLLAWFRPSSSEPSHKVSTLKAAEVRSLEISIGSAPKITLERAETGWEIAAPFSARADNFQVQRLLELLDAKSNERFPATGLARYGLNEPYARVTIDRQEFSFGAFNEMSREQYVLSGDGVYLLPLRYAAALPKTAFALVSKQLFAASEAPVDFDFGSFQVEQADGKSTMKWTKKMAPATDTEAGPDDINRWIDDWRLASALGVQAPTGRKPVGALKVHLKTGHDVIIKVLERGTNTVIARSDLPFEYLLSAETAARLLSPPTTAPPPAPTPAPAK
jgi:hypothetical protein